jgi:hypothetical protein
MPPAVVGQALTARQAELLQQQQMAENAAELAGIQLDDVPQEVCDHRNRPCPCHCPHAVLPLPACHAAKQLRCGALLVPCSQMRCQGMKPNGEQCKRKKNTECGDYCKTHYKIYSKPETPPEVKMQLKPDAAETLKNLVPDLFTTLSAEYVDVSHILEDGKLIVEYKLKDKDQIIANLAAKVKEGACVCELLDRSYTDCSLCVAGSPGGAAGSAEA